MNTNDSMLELYLTEAFEIVNNLEILIMESEEVESLDDNIDIIFRNMHTIKGNSMMMMFENIAELAHKIEDLFDFIRGNKEVKTDYTILADIVLNAVDYMKEELNKIENGFPNDKSPSNIIKSSDEYLKSLKFMNPDADFDKNENDKNEDQKYYISASSKDKEKVEYNNYYVHLKYNSDTEMVNIRGLTSLKKIEDFAIDIYSFPKDIVKQESVNVIKNKGIGFIFKTEEDKKLVEEEISKIAFLSSYEVKEITLKEYNDKRIVFENVEIEIKEEKEPEIITDNERQEDDVNKEISIKQKRKLTKHTNTNIKVDVAKVDRLMDLVGELVVSESMLNEGKSNSNSDENMAKAENQLSRVISELQEAVMSVRMVPLKLTFQKMKRIVRDASKKVNKEIDLKIIGDETEVDKNVIEKLGDPLMHIIRNSVDHGIEDPDIRLNYNKAKKGNIILKAKQTAGNVVITIQDDGGGLNTEKILDKAESKNLLNKSREEYTENQVYNLLFEPGFSTNDSVTELSGRGVGLDVVRQNIKDLNGSVDVKSELYKGTQFIIKIPLTLAIINGVLIDVSDSIFILPTVSIIESYAIKDQKVFINGDGNEMIMIRDKVYPLIRLNNKFNIDSKKNTEEGIVTMIENEDSKLLLHSDRILGKRQVVVKNLSSFMRDVKGISGCALLGDGRISFILNPSDLSA